MKALLFSGGIDSTCLAWIERPDRLVFVDYGQIPAEGELRACRAVAEELSLPFDVLQTDLRLLGSGVMAGVSNARDRRPEFWPFRNQMLITLAAMALERHGLSEILVGTVRTDRQHPDGRLRFINAMNRVLQSQSAISLRAPAANETTEELVARSGVPLSVLGWTFSCHTGEWACGQCNGCRKHLDVMASLRD